jgi:hypothetical protein
LRQDAPECVRNYKSLANVERAFCSLKTIEWPCRGLTRCSLHRSSNRESVGWAIAFSMTVVSTIMYFTLDALITPACFAASIVIG